MIKLLLVDDEPLALVGVQSMLSWDEYGIEICGTARSGEMAMELIEEKRPDIVITDIVMPVMNGLELMLECRKKYGRIPLFIVLTCVEEYQHVKQAIGHQAVDYLIKLELTSEILSQSILKATDTLHSLGGKGVGYLLPMERPGTQTMYDKFFMSLFGNFFEDREHFESKREELGIELSYDSFIVCYCELNKQDVDKPNDEAGEAHLTELYTSAARMAKETISNITDCYITNLNVSNFIITFCLNEQESADYRRVLSKVMEPAIRIIKNYFGVDLSCTVGASVSCPLEIHSSYYSARRALDERDREQLLHYCGDNQISNSAFKTGKPTNKSHTVEKIKDYIRENLDKRLTLNQVSEKFGFSPKYISLLFAKHAECSFVEFINAEKMASARELLLSDNAMVYEVSEKLGFENAFYFSKVFKKHYGVSPREFVKRVEN